VIKLRIFRVGTRMLNEIEYKNANWICLAQKRDKWRAVVNMVMNLRVSYNAEKFLIREQCILSSVQVL
jgi:hypothetical protein